MQGFCVTNCVKLKVLFFRKATNYGVIESPSQGDNSDPLRSFCYATLAEEMKIFANLYAD
jgi:hypothetical protein